MRSYLGYLLISLGLLIVGLVVAWLAFKANRLYTTYRDMAPHLASLQTLVSRGPANPAEIDLAQLETSLQGTATGLETLSAELTPFLPLTVYLGWVPNYGGDLQAAPYLLAAGRDVSQAGVLLVEPFVPLLAHKSDGAQSALLSQAVMTLDQAAADVERASAHLRRAEVLLGQVEVERLSPEVARPVTHIQQYLPGLIAALPLASSLPDLLGAGSPQAYLILFQNSDELRPSGGHINAAGHIVFDRGRIAEFVMQDSYAVDRISEAYPYPPEPLYRYMATDYWLLRDASWSPDFPTTARTALYLYGLGQGISAAGVIAIDQEALPYLLRAVEPLEVEGEQVTGDNVIRLLRRHWAPAPDQALDADWWLGRKSFILALAQAIRQKFEAEPGVINFSVLADALSQALAEKHLLIYLADPAWADFLAEKNWSGLLRPVPGDYLMVVDANLGFNKAGALVERRLSYQVNIAEDGSAQAYLNLIYQHGAQKHLERCRHEPRYDPVYEQNMERCYWNYLSLVVPAGARLIRGPRVVVQGQYLLRGQPTKGDIDIVPLGSDKVGWGQLFLLAPGESISLDYVYALPPGTVSLRGDHWQYTLYLQKLPGTLAPAAKVVVNLPEGAQVLESRPPPQSQREESLSYLINLKTDRAIEISYTFP